MVASIRVLSMVLSLTFDGRHVNIRKLLYGTHNGNYYRNCNGKLNANTQMLNLHNISCCIGREFINWHIEQNLAHAVVFCVI